MFQRLLIAIVGIGFGVGIDHSLSPIQWIGTAVLFVILGCLVAIDMDWEVG